MTKNILSPIFESSKECLEYTFGEKITFPEILIKLLGEKIGEEIAREIVDFEIGGARMNGTGTPQSDLDVDVQVKSLPDFDKRLTKLDIPHKYGLTNDIEKTFGSHDYIMVYPGEYKNVPIEINAEEYPPSEQRLIVMGKFIRQFFREHPEKLEWAIRVKRMAEEGIPGGYRKPIILLYEDFMKEDLGGCPKRRDTDPLGRTFPQYDEIPIPHDWMYLRETLGLEGAKKKLQEMKKEGLISLNFLS